VPLGDDAGVLDTLIMGGRTIIMSMVNAKTPPAVLPQGAIPFGVVGLFITTFEAVGEGGALAFVGLVLGDGACF